MSTKCACTESCAGIDCNSPAKSFTSSRQRSVVAHGRMLMYRLHLHLLAAVDRAAPSGSSVSMSTETPFSMFSETSDSMATEVPPGMSSASLTSMSSEESASMSTELVSSEPDSWHNNTSPEVESLGRSVSTVDDVHVWSHICAQREGSEGIEYHVHWQNADDPAEWYPANHILNSQVLVTGMACPIASHELKSNYTNKTVPRRWLPKDPDLAAKLAVKLGTHPRLQQIPTQQLTTDILEVLCSVPVDLIAYLCNEQSSLPGDSLNAFFEQNAQTPIHPSVYLITIEERDKVPTLQMMRDCHALAYAYYKGDTDAVRRVERVTDHIEAHHLEDIRAGFSIEPKRRFSEHSQGKRLLFLMYAVLIAQGYEVAQKPRVIFNCAVSTQSPGLSVMSNQALLHDNRITWQEPEERASKHIEDADRSLQQRETERKQYLSELQRHVAILKDLDDPLDRVPELRD
ncbi:hypothetical protein MRB53_041507 [Persea americana]|nr:hypothetical protein MRB53_041507 [Persea americana]